MKFIRKHPLITLAIFYIVFVFCFSILEGRPSSFLFFLVFWPGAFISHIMSGFAIHPALFLSALFEILLVVLFYLLWYFFVWKKRDISQPLPAAQLPVTSTPNRLERLLLLPLATALLVTALGFVFLMIVSSGSNNEGIGYALLGILVFYPAPVFLLTLALGKIFPDTQKYRRAILVLLIISVGIMLLMQ